MALCAAYLHTNPLSLSLCLLRPGSFRLTNDRRDVREDFLPFPFLGKEREAAAAAAFYKGERLLEEKG